MQPGGQIDLWAKATVQGPQALANQMLQSGTDDATLQREIAMTPALKVQLEEGRQKAKDALDEQVKNAQIAASQAATVRSGAQQAQAEATTKKTNIETERIERGETPVPTAPSTTAPATTRTSEGVMQWNPKTGKYDIKVGNLPPTASQLNAGTAPTTDDAAAIAGDIVNKSL